MNKLESMSFRKDFVLPVEEQDRMLGFIKWGKKNDYPFFLVDLFNGSAWHQGIIKNKTYYIAGGGLEVVSGELSRFLANSYTDFTMDEIVEQLAFDYDGYYTYRIYQQTSSTNLDPDLSDGLVEEGRAHVYQQDSPSIEFSTNITFNIYE